MVLDGDSDSQDAVFVVQGFLGVKTGQLASFKDVVSDNHSTPVAADVASRDNVARIQTSKNVGAQQHHERTSNESAEPR